MDGDTRKNKKRMGDEQVHFGVLVMREQRVDSKNRMRGKKEKKRESEGKRQRRGPPKSPKTVKRDPGEH